MSWESDPLLYAVDAHDVLRHIDSVANGAARCSPVSSLVFSSIAALNTDALLLPNSRAAAKLHFFWRIATVNQSFAVKGGSCSHG